MFNSFDSVGCISRYNFNFNWMYHTLNNYKAEGWLSNHMLSSNRVSRMRWRLVTNRNLLSYVKGCCECKYCIGKGSVSSFNYFICGGLVWVAGDPPDVAMFEQEICLILELHSFVHNHTFWHCDKNDCFLLDEVSDHLPCTQIWASTRCPPTEIFYD